jgi:Rhodopirellula transposase DDE domain
MIDHPEWLTAFDEVVAPNTAGLPQNLEVKWTHLTQAQIVERMQQKGCSVSRYHVKQLLLEKGFKRRNLFKNKELKSVEGRNEQFEKINCVKDYFLQKELPVLSIDTKKKEMIGEFHRNGSRYCTEAREVLDHDFNSYADGLLVPHGIYDVGENKGYISLGTSKDTSLFVCDNISYYWQNHLQFKYAEAHTILLLCDGGGSNSCYHHIFKQDLMDLASALQVDILVAHYPAYCSKYNPIEHRLFSQITHTWQGIPFTNIQFVKELTDQWFTKEFGVGNA